MSLGESTSAFAEKPVTTEPVRCTYFEGAQESRIRDMVPQAPEAPVGHRSHRMTAQPMTAMAASSSISPRLGPVPSRRDYARPPYSFRR